jgi:hypothetical protein
VFHVGTCPASAQLLSGNRLNITFVGMRPHIMYGSPVDGGGDFNMFDALARKHNYTYVWKASKTFGWGKDKKTGKDFGAIYHVSLKLSEGV